MAAPEGTESKPGDTQKVPSRVSGKVADCSVSRLSPFMVSDSDSDDDVFVKCTPKNHCRSRQLDPQKCTGGRLLPASLQKKPVASRYSPNSSCSERRESSTKESSEDTAPILSPKSRTSLGLSSSEEETDCLSVRLKQKLVLPSTQRSVAQVSTAEQSRAKPFCTRRPAVKSDSALPRLPKSPFPDQSVSAQGSKSKVLADVPQLSWLRMRSSCQVQGCFLQELSDPNSQRAKHFQRQKEELAQNLYAFYNHSVFEQKLTLFQLPEKMEIVWSKKMRKTAGYCFSGQQKDPEGHRYARIMLSEKVCDSADRLRDTLIHELCHAAAWLLHGVQDGHGRIWSLYAKRSALIHPELPVVSRCHNYTIKYKFVYECSRCQNEIGRHSKSLDTQRFVCALCQGQLVLRQPLRKGGAPAAASLTPFAKYVKENYASAKRAQQGLSHGAVMRKLSADFAAQAHLPGP
ncbi:germ cell nuclear acidic protein [Tiliqua scincoides]|uniref:germ cell nuclear acidic protein n=1 Tax=Tiliqua scincoides TaxID=71010 RepID=UPI003461A417